MLFVSHMKDKFLKCVAYDLSVDFRSFLPKDAIAKREDISFLKQFKANIQLVYNSLPRFLEPCSDN